MKTRLIAAALLTLAATLATTFASSAQAAEASLLNVSYDPTRELYQDVNKNFAAQWKAQSGSELKIK